MPRLREDARQLQCRLAADHTPTRRSSARSFSTTAAQKYAIGAGITAAAGHMSTSQEDRPLRLSFPGPMVLLRCRRSSHRMAGFPQGLARPLSRHDSVWSADTFACVTTVESFRSSLATGLAGRHTHTLLCVLVGTPSPFQVVLPQSGPALLDLD
jgi:hypothetical protein